VEITDEHKVSIDIFHPIKILGEGGIGKVVLAKKKSPDGSDQLCDIKVLKKVHIISDCIVSCAINEKEALIVASGQPFITAVYFCFQMEVIFTFLNLLHILKVIINAFYCQFKNVVIILNICGLLN
jgi:serine/threonine protein kinase